MLAKKIEPIHPGEILEEEFLDPLNISRTLLAKAISVSSKTISELLSKKRSLNADLALRFSRFFKNSPQFWMGLQMEFDLASGENKVNLEKKLRNIKTYLHYTKAA
ncbi:MAG: HigA family addiction module antidote protein [Deltaproteobacteria bacterium]|nr:HigA family addiction module antidote protein [Deltaproteobacteria bacterium]